LRQIAAALHFPADEFFLMRREQNFHGEKLKAASDGVKKFSSVHLMRYCPRSCAVEINRNNERNPAKSNRVTGNKKR
jgi:hypothetical protein